MESSRVHRSRNLFTITFKILLITSLTGLFPPSAFAEESICFGTPKKGRLENGVQLPRRGKNYQVYSDLGNALGRNYVHSQIANLILKTYLRLESDAPSKIFMYGETGWKKGGSFKPHKTHQNGLSVDFMVPVLDSSGKSVALPTSPFNKFGYGIEFDNSGKFENYKVDFDAIAEHLFVLADEAAKLNIGISLVVFDLPLVALLKKSSEWLKLNPKITFSQKKPWIRHDEHYHIDFSVRCLELK